MDLISLYAYYNTYACLYYLHNKSIVPIMFR